jgi:hypothetical protein
VKISLAPVALALGLALAAPAGADHVPRAWVATGDLVEFRGSRMQCLPFSGVRAIKGRRGVACWLGPPRRYARGTYWGALTAAWITSSDTRNAVLDSIFRRTTVRRTVRIPLNGWMRIAGTDLGCWYELSRTVSYGDRIVTCGEHRETRGAAGTTGFTLSERMLAFIEFGSDGRISKASLTRKQP